MSLFRPGHFIDQTEYFEMLPFFWDTLYLPLHDVPFWKWQTKDNAMVTSAADLSDLQTKPNNAYLPLHDIPFWKCQTKDIVMVTSAADLGDLQTKPNQILQIYPYMIYLFENGRPRTMQWWPLQLILVTSKPNQTK